MVLCESASYTTRMSDWDIKKAIGANLERIRESLDLTQEEFGERLGTDQSTISLWETGGRLPRLPDLVERLERANIDPRALVPVVGASSAAAIEPDPDVLRVTAALRDLPPDVRRRISELAETLRESLPRDYDAESAELMEILARVDPTARTGVLKGVRQTLAALGLV
jgi:transcriptional regulator with XRE-family HTH domain